MVDQCRSLVKDSILADYVKNVDQCQTLDAMVQPTIDAMRKLASQVLTMYFLILVRRDDPQEESKELRDDLGKWQKTLQAAIDEKNASKQDMIETMQSEIDMFKLSQKRMKEKGLQQSSGIDKALLDMTEDIKKMQTECQNNQDILTALVKETKNKIIEKISLIQ